MSESDKNETNKQPPENNSSEKAITKKLNLDLSENEEPSIISIDIDNEPDRIETARLTIEQQDIVSSGSGSLINMELGDLPELSETRRLTVDIDEDLSGRQFREAKNCPFCGDKIDSSANFCRLCASRSTGSEQPAVQRKILRKNALVAAGALVIIGAILIYVTQFVTTQVAQKPIPVPSPDLLLSADNSTIQDAINAANDGAVIAIAPLPYYGPLDFKGKNLTMILDESDNNKIKSGYATEIAVSGAVITLFNAPEIESLLKSYTLIEGSDGRYKELTYKAQTNYHEHQDYPGTYFELAVKGSNLAIRGKTVEAGQWIRVKIDSGTFEGEYKANSGANHLFEITIPPKRSERVIRTETVALNIRQSNKSEGPFGRFYPDLMATLNFNESGLEKVAFASTLAYDGNSRAWNTYRDPSRYLNANPNIQSDDPRIVEMADNLVTQGMSDFQKVVEIHNWVTTNIAYDASYLKTGKRSPQDAVSVLETGVAVCAGYARLFAALLRSQGIAARYVSGNAIGSHDTGRGWEEEGLYNHPVGHAWNEVHIEGEWITVDATWNAGYIDSNTGKFVFKQSFRYFAPSLEFFSRSHFIP